MKKAYNVYSFLGKTVTKAAMVTSVFALCFLLAGQVYGQAPSPAIGPKTFTAGPGQNVGQTDFELYAGVNVPYNSLQTNQSRLNPELIRSENATPIASNLFEQHNTTFNVGANESAEMEFELRRVFLQHFAGSLRQGVEFNTAFTNGLEKMTAQFGAYDNSLYKGPSLNAIAENYIANFF